MTSQRQYQYGHQVTMEPQLDRGQYVRRDLPDTLTRGGTTYDYEVTEVSHGSRGVSPGLHGVSHDTRRVMTHDTRGVSHDTRGVSHDTRGMSHDTRGVSHETRGMSHDTRGMSHDPRGLPPPGEDCEVKVLLSMPGIMPVDTNGYGSQHTTTTRRQTTETTRQDGVQLIDGKCTCCPYGYHVDLDFVRFAEDTAGGSSNGTMIRQLKQIKRDKKKLRKSMEVYLDQQDGYIETGDPQPDMSTHTREYDYDTRTNRTLNDIDSHINRNVRREVTTTTRRLDFESDGSSPSPISSPMSPYENRPLGYRTDSISSLTSNTTVGTEVSGIPSLGGTTKYTSVTAQLASVLAQYLPRPDPSGQPVMLPHDALTVLRQQLAVSLQRIRELEEQAKQVPVMQVRMSVLKEEKRLLMLQLKSRQNKLNVRSTGSSSDRVDDSTYFSGDQMNAFRSMVSTTSSNVFRLGPNGPYRPEMRSIGVGGGIVTDRYYLQPDLIDRVAEMERESNIERTIREKEYHTVVLGNEQHSPFSSLKLRKHTHDRRPTTRSVGVGDNSVFEVDKIQVQEKELRTIIIGGEDEKLTRNVGISVRVATRDVGVHYHHEDEKPQMRDVSCSFGTRDSFATQQMYEAHYAKTIMETIQTMGLFGNAEIKKWVMGVLHKEVRSASTQCRPEGKNQATSTVKVGGFTRTIGVSSDSIDVEVRPIKVTKSVGVSCEPKMSSKWTWMDNEFTVSTSTNTEAVNTKSQATFTVPLVSFAVATNTDVQKLYNVGTNTEMKMFLATDQLRNVGCNTAVVRTHDSNMGTSDDLRMLQRVVAVNTDRISTKTKGVGDCRIDDWGEKKTRTEIVKQTTQEPETMETWTVTQKIPLETETLTTYETKGAALGYLNRYGEHGPGGTIEVERHVTKKTEDADDAISTHYGSSSGRHTSGIAVRDFGSSGSSGLSRDGPDVSQTKSGTTIIRESHTESRGYGGSEDTSTVHRPTIIRESHTESRGYGGGSEDMSTVNRPTIIRESHTESRSYGGGSEDMSVHRPTYKDIIGGKMIIDTTYRSPLALEREKRRQLDESQSTERTLQAKIIRDFDRNKADDSQSSSKVSKTEIVRDISTPTVERSVTRETSGGSYTSPRQTSESSSSRSFSTRGSSMLDGGVISTGDDLLNTGDSSTSYTMQSETIRTSSQGDGDLINFGAGSPSARFRTEQVISSGVLGKSGISDLTLGGTSDMTGGSSLLGGATVSSSIIGGSTGESSILDGSMESSSIRGGSTASRIVGDAGGSSSLLRDTIGSLIGGSTGDSSMESSSSYRTEQSIMTGGSLETGGKSSYGQSLLTGAGTLDSSGERIGGSSFSSTSDGTVRTVESGDGRTLVREQQTKEFPGGGRMRTEKVTIKSGNRARNSREMLVDMGDMLGSAGTGGGSYKTSTQLHLSSSGGSGGSSDASSGFSSMGSGQIQTDQLQHEMQQKTQEMQRHMESQMQQQQFGGDSNLSISQAKQMFSGDGSMGTDLGTDFGGRSSRTVTMETRSSGGRGFETDIDADLGIRSVGGAGGQRIMSSSGDGGGGQVSSSRTVKSSWSSGSGEGTGGVRSILKSVRGGSNRKGISFARGTVGGSASSSSQSEDENSESITQNGDKKQNGDGNQNGDDKQNDDDKVNGEEEEAEDSTSTSSYDEGSYDGTLGNIIYTCRDDELISNGQPGARMFEQNIRETYELTPEVQEACEVLSQDIDRPGSVSRLKLNDAEKLIQSEWFNASSQRSSSAELVEDFLSGFNEFSKEVMERIVNMTDANGNTALHYAVSHGNFDVSGLLLDTGLADVNKTNNAGYNTIMLAALSDVNSEEQKDVVKRMFDLGDINASASQAGQTALMLAVSHGRAEMVRHLLEAGASVNARDEDGSTALMCACEHGHTDIVRMLLAQPNCDHSLKDNDGSTALSIAMEAGHKDIGVLLYAKQNYSLPSPAPTKARQKLANLTPRLMSKK